MTEIPFILVHLGNEFFPDYINIAIEQCHKWNKNNPIYCILSQNHKNKIEHSYVKQIYLENLTKTLVHHKFIETSSLDIEFRNGFWRYSTERFFVLEDFCLEYNIQEFFHFENDNMLYFNINSLINILRQNVKGIASPTLGLNQNSFGIFYCNSIVILQQFNIHLISGDLSLEEMTKGHMFFKEHKNSTFFLPSIPLIQEDLSDIKQELISSKIQIFQGIFDPAQYGQWLGGVDPRNQVSGAFMFSNERAIIEANCFDYIIKICNENNLNRYHLINKEYNIDLPIFVLHIHSKNLKQFLL